MIVLREHVLLNMIPCISLVQGDQAQGRKTDCEDKEQSDAGEIEEPGEEYQHNNADDVWVLSV